MQGKLTTDCDGPVRHRKWQEPAGTLSMALTAYKGTGQVGATGLGWVGSDVAERERVRHAVSDLLLLRVAGEGGGALRAAGGERTGARLRSPRP